MHTILQCSGVEWTVDKNIWYYEEHWTIPTIKPCSGEVWSTTGWCLMWQSSPDDIISALQDVLNHFYSKCRTVYFLSSLQRPVLPQKTMKFWKRKHTKNIQYFPSVRFLWKRSILEVRIIGFNRLLEKLQPLNITDNDYSL